MRRQILLSVVATVFTIGGGAQVTPFSLDSDDAIKQSASTLAWDMMQYYKGNLSGQTPGILPGPPPAGPYYWWEAGAMWATLIDYWAWTGDASYNDEVMQAMLWQVGPNDAYMPPNVTASLGNDDQGFWGMSAMTAAEMKFPNPPSDKPQWLALAQAVFNTQASPDRHDGSCGGGLRWQIPFANNGYNYKASIANGCFFNLGARLYRYTGNATFSHWAENTWNWMEGVGFLNSATYAIYDGANVGDNCTDINKAEFSYNNGIFALGAAYMYNTTKDQVWADRVTKLVNYGLKTFFPGGIAVEITCEDEGTCTTDMITYKGFMHRWYSYITQLAPFTANTINPVLKTSAAAAVKQCAGGAYRRQCGFKWASGKYDGTTGAGQEMSVLAAVSSQLINVAGKAPVTADSGGISTGDPSAGSGADNFQNKTRPVTTADRVGASIVTLLLLAGAGAVFGSMVMKE
ncbi:Mannan endo-1,6-alpha-mannosidase [Metarhizium anisopliae BRIP 53293]|uniref:Mannan endo-1,6-alpha-mannosidase n=1 Tax=Metarhizium anisopliae BRIP 53293 TaxID=1291518 RepID=A0A0D9NQB8_METAN|nr:Mannan endo-1,6-alpha-mannosidase [Metarhizium anisopliae BRIP 53293]KJK96048.1 Mannan endo-1,6-alpha-mannosidase [Metarhizium anisopliae BRIP 53284]